MIVWAKLTTEQRLAYVKPLWLEGRSPASIAKGISGATRHSIIGILWRAGLKRNDGGLSRRLEAHNVRGARAPTVARNKGAGSGHNMKGSKTGGPPAVIFAGPGAVMSPTPRAPFHGKANAFSALPGSNPLPWTERPFNGCSWPVGENDAGELLSCCLPASKRGWCESRVRVGLTSPPPGKPANANEMMRALRRYVSR